MGTTDNTARTIRTMADVRAAAAGGHFFDRRPWSEPSTVVGGPYRVDDGQGFFVTRDQYRSHRTAAEDGPVRFIVWRYGTGTAGRFDIRPAGSEHTTRDAAAEDARQAAADERFHGLAED